MDLLFSSHFEAAIFAKSIAIFAPATSLIVGGVSSDLNLTYINQHNPGVS
jgi:hypothetical protein